MYRRFVHDSIRRFSINFITYSQIKRFYLTLLCEKCIKPSTLQLINNSPVFKTAVRDELIRINPTDGVIKDLKKNFDFQKREPNLLPKFGVHVLRHTFCTRFCENETN